MNSEELIVAIDTETTAIAPHVMPDPPVVYIQEGPLGEQKRVAAAVVELVMGEPRLVLRVEVDND